jgi:exopolysaccharide biosynthesis polyprenyl glycosylphosphotransferase
MNQFAAPRIRRRTRTVIPAALDRVRHPATARPARIYLNRLRVSDTGVVIAATALAFIGSVHDDPSAITALVLAGTWLAALALFRTRELAVLVVGSAEFTRVIHASVSSLGALALLTVILGVAPPSSFFLVGFATGVGGLTVERLLNRRWLREQERAGVALSRVVVVGRLSDVETVLGQLARTPGTVHHVVGAVLKDPVERIESAELRGVPVQSGLRETVGFLRRVDGDTVIVAGQPDPDDDFVRQLAWELERTDIRLVLATSLTNITGRRVRLRAVDGLSLLHVEIPRFSGWMHVAKRALDIIIAGAALVALAPVLAAIAVLIRLDSPGAVLFSQDRVGLNGEHFRMYKFRSMVPNATKLLATLERPSDGNGVLFKLKVDPRVTRIGRVLRRYSLDELPQLWNVLTGTMSLVGPRPPLPSEVHGYEEHVRRRLHVKPGLTGPWQVSGRSTLSWEDSVRLDLHYVENWSLLGDLAIIGRTVRAVIQPVGAY